MYQIYQVQSYDTLENIARNFNTTIDELKKINGITDFTPVMGAPLIVPKVNSGNYIVQRGDSLYSIAKYIYRFYWKYLNSHFTSLINSIILIFDHIEIFNFQHFFIVR